MDLAEGELIEEVEQLDEGWWSGVGNNGAKNGLFPGGSGSRFSPVCFIFSHQPITSS